MTSPISDILPGILKFSADKGYVQKHDVERAEQAILSVIAEAIGKDEFDQQEIDDTENGSFVPFMVRNQLRAEIRQKLGIGEQPKGEVGKLYGVTIAHQNYVGDTREHIDPPENCWCWVGGNKG
jgi:hypothetical protein